MRDSRWISLAVTAGTHSTWPGKGWARSASTVQWNRWRQAGKRLSDQALKASFVRGDLARFTLPANAFSVVICFKYRNHEFYPSIRAALRPGGLLIYETYTCEHASYGLKPRNPEHLLERNELLRAFGDWEIIFYREVWIGRGTASLVARKPLGARES